MARPLIDAMPHGLAHHHRFPAGHVVDGAYPAGAKLVTSQHEYQIDLLGPMRQEQSWQAHDE